MDINNPFETFETTAFRLEGLPQYRVKEEVGALKYFNKYGKVPGNIDSKWAKLVEKNMSDGKTMERLLLLSDPLSNYENFEIHAYSGTRAGEKIHVAKRDDYDYKYDFWFFDKKWITRINYTDDGSFIGFDTSKASESDIDMFEYWYAVFNKAKSIEL
jgi:hypothetical protein